MREPKAFPAADFVSVYLDEPMKTVTVRRPLNNVALDQFTMDWIADFESTAVIQPNSEIVELAKRYYPHMQLGLLTYVHVVNEVYREMAWRGEELREEIRNANIERDLNT